ncbi:hypothetical protein GCM10009549_01300 [Streptomyces thermoalcalitolerans]|uniref:Uncharacterized protein n=1 Tax=Streptomyces thermoalcalitolerans TaxID=65605 RepID=A0ABP3YRT3_9ACTN
MRDRAEEAAGVPREGTPARFCRFAVTFVNTVLRLPTPYCDDMTAVARAEA